MVGIVVMVLLAGAIAVVVFDNHRQNTPQVATTALATAPVVRTDLVETQQIAGTLGYAGSVPVPARPVAGAVLTLLPQVGQTVQRGQELYGVNGNPVPLIYGGAPLWRPLSVGVPDGSDVQELKENLRALGYGPGLADDGHYSQGTADAVKDWQGVLGLPKTGALQPQDVVVASGAVRVTGVTAAVGAGPAGNLMTLSSTDRVVSVNLPVAQQTLAVAGAAVRVELPDSTIAAGHISQVGTVATAPTPAQGSQPDPDQATVVVQVTLDRPSDAGSLDGAPVEVDFTSQTRSGVLAVPVDALLALPAGGYAVEVVTGQTSRLVVVTLGIFAAGQVQVSGAGITAGTRVEVPSST
ncbi:MAG TPA: peptidoglycan-binding domain-containing protein [Pseudonocardiaceae bacterium]|nr:peptidoglycan-binding domain-containing protein [Pseudonocardiaceae bacterium]